MNPGLFKRDIFLFVSFEERKSIHVCYPIIVSISICPKSYFYTLHVVTIIIIILFIHFFPYGYKYILGETAHLASHTKEEKEKKEKENQLFGSNQSFSSKHGFTHFSDHIRTISRTKQHNATTTATHASGSTEPVDEINRSVGNIIENHVTDRNSVNSSRAQIGGDNNFGVGKNTFAFCLALLSWVKILWRRRGRRGIGKGGQRFSLARRIGIAMESKGINALFVEISSYSFSIFALVDKNQDTFDGDRLFALIGIVVAVCFADLPNGVGAGKILVATVRIFIDVDNAQLDAAGNGV